MMSGNDKLRIDKWLWAVRIFKTRSLATEACKAGRVKVGGNSVKPSYVVKVDDELSVQKGVERKLLKVVQLIEKRVDATKAALCYLDQTPEEEKLKQRAAFYSPTFRRDRGTGRPTKRERRDIDRLQQGWDDREN